MVDNDKFLLEITGFSETDVQKQIFPLRLDMFRVSPTSRQLLVSLSSVSVRREPRKRLPYVWEVREPPFVLRECFRRVCCELHCPALSWDNISVIRCFGWRCRAVDISCIFCRASPWCLPWCLPAASMPLRRVEPSAFPPAVPFPPIPFCVHSAYIFSFPVGIRL